ncbi:MAG: hypothetical protein WCD53_31715 [Microcoleus sp.]
MRIPPVVGEPFGSTQGKLRRTVDNLRSTALSRRSLVEWGGLIKIVGG